MSRPALVVSLLALLAAAGCEKTSTPVETPAPEPEPPAALLAVVELPSGTNFATLADAVGQIAPEAKAAVATGLPMQLGKLLGEAVAPVDALALDGPMRLLVVATPNEELELLFVVRTTGKLEASDGFALTKLGDHALVGRPDALALVEAHAPQLVAEPVTELRATGFPGHLLAAYGAKLDALPAMLAAEPASPIDLAALMQIYVEMLRALGESSERIVATLESESGAAHLIFRVHARPDSALATFFGDQKPSSFELHDKLPAGKTGMMFIEGSLRASVALEPMLRFTEAFFGAVENGPAMMKAVRRYADILTGDSVMLMNMQMGAAMPTPEGVALYGVTDAALAIETTTEVMKLWSGTRKVMGIDQTITFDGAKTHHGVPLIELTTTMSVPDPAGGGEPLAIENRSTFTADGELMIYAMGERSTELATRALDHQRQRGDAFTPSAALERALVRAKRNKDSALMFFDMSSMMPLPGSIPTFAMTLGFEKNVATLTLSAMKK